MVLKLAFYLISQEIARKGKEGFYKGRIAEAIVDEVQFYGGALTLDDLAQHTSTMVTPISTQYKEYKIWEMPPNGLGITALNAFNILEGFDLKGNIYKILIIFL